MSSEVQEALSLYRTVLQTDASPDSYQEFATAARTHEFHAYLATTQELVAAAFSFGFPIQKMKRGDQCKEEAYNELMCETPASVAPLKKAAMICRHCESTAREGQSPCQCCLNTILLHQSKLSAILEPGNIRGGQCLSKPRFLSPVVLDQGRGYLVLRRSSAQHVAILNVALRLGCQIGCCAALSLRSSAEHYCRGLCQSCGTLTSPQGLAVSGNNSHAVKKEWWLL
jgi:hypothetical protein